MKFSTQYERVKRQVFRFDEADLRRLVDEAARKSQGWCAKPAGVTERVEIECEYDPGDIDEGCVVTLTRTFVAEDEAGAASQE